MNDEKGQGAIGIGTIISEFRGMMRNRDLAVLNFAILVGSIIAAVFSGLIAFTATFALLLVIIIFYTIGRSIARPLIPAIISSLTAKENRGKGMGLYTFVQNVAFAVGSTAGGYVSQVFGREFPFLMASGVGLAGIAVFALYVSDSDTIGGGIEGGSMIRQKWE